MKKYANLGEKESGVESYEYDATSITVQYKSGKQYTYSYESAGEDNIEHMKELADSGIGLGTFINKNVSDKFVK